MRSRPAACAITAVLCLLMLGTVAAQQPNTASLERVTVAGRKGDVSKWLRAESPHFVVYSDAREEDVTPLLENLEKLDHLLRLYTQPEDNAAQPGPKLTLYHHTRPGDLREVDASAPADAVGLYNSCASGVQGFGVLLDRIPSFGDAQLDKAPLDDTLSYVFEAYARHFLYRHTDIRSPASFIDGFAQYFSSVRFSEQQMVVGRTPRAIGQYLHFLNEGRRYSLDYEDVLQNNLANARSYGGAAGVRLELEAKSWLLTHYMLSSEDRRKRLSRYLLAVERGAPAVRAFERIFDVKAGEIGPLMWRHGRTGVTALRVAAPPQPATRVSFKTLPLAAGEFLLAEAALKSCPGRPAGEALLKQVAGLAARFPADERARLTLSRAQIDWGNPQDAVAPLNAVLAADDTNVEAWLLLGAAELRLAQRAAAADARRVHLQAAQGHLRRARALNPLSPEAALAAFNAEVALTDQPDGAALRDVVSAWQASRDVNALGRSAALAHAFAGNADAAQQTLGSLADQAGDPPLAQWAKQWQDRLIAGVSRRDILAEMRSGPVADTPVKTWTVDKRSAMQAVERTAGLEAADSFLKQQGPEGQRQDGGSSRGGLPDRPGR